MDMAYCQTTEQSKDQIRSILKSTLSCWDKLSPSTINSLLSVARQVQFSKNSNVFTQGNSDYSLYLLHRGLWRIYYITKTGREYIKVFLKEGMLFVPLKAYLQQQPVEYSVQALESSLAIRIPYEVFAGLLEEDKELLKIWRCHMENHFLRHEERERVLLSTSGAERYQHFVQTYEGLEKRIPQYHIASYLGLTEQSLSRIKATVQT